MQTRHGRTLPMRPWLVRLVTSQKVALGQRLHVLRRLSGPHPDGSTIKEVTDGHAAIKAIFSQEALAKFSQNSEDCTPPDWNNSLIKVNKFSSLHIHHKEKEQCEFQLQVQDFSLIALQEGFRRNTIPDPIMTLPEVRAYSNCLWEKQVASLNVLSEDGRQQSMTQSSQSFALSDLLAQMGAQSLETDGGEISDGQDAGQELCDPISLPVTGFRNFCIEYLLIPHDQQDILNAIPEWQLGYQPIVSQNPASQELTDSHGTSHELIHVGMEEGVHIQASSICRPSGEISAAQNRYTFRNAKRAVQMCKEPQPEISYGKYGTGERITGSADVEAVGQKNKTNLQDNTHGREHHSISVQTGASLLACQGSRPQLAEVVSNRSVQVGNSLAMEIDDDRPVNQDLGISSTSHQKQKANDVSHSPFGEDIISFESSKSVTKSCEKKKQTRFRDIQENHRTREHSGDNYDSISQGTGEILVQDTREFQSNKDKTPLSHLKQGPVDLGTTEIHLDLLCSKCCVLDTNMVSTQADKTDRLIRPLIHLSPIKCLRCSQGEHMQHKQNTCSNCGVEFCEGTGTQSSNSDPLAVVPDTLMDDTWEHSHIDYLQSKKDIFVADEVEEARLEALRSVSITASGYKGDSSTRSGATDRHPIDRAKTIQSSTQVRDVSFSTHPSGVSREISSAKCSKVEDITDSDGDHQIVASVEQDSENQNDIEVICEYEGIPHPMASMNQAVVAKKTRVQGNKVTDKEHWSKSSAHRGDSLDLPHGDLTTSVEHRTQEDPRQQVGEAKNRDARERLDLSDLLTNVMETRLVKLKHHRNVCHNPQVTVTERTGEDDDCVIVEVIPSSVITNKRPRLFIPNLKRKFQSEVEDSLIVIGSPPEIGDAAKSSTGSNKGLDHCDNAVLFPKKRQLSGKMHRLLPLSSSILTEADVSQEGNASSKKTSVHRGSDTISRKQKQSHLMGTQSQVSSRRTDHFSCDQQPLLGPADSAIGNSVEVATAVQALPTGCGDGDNCITTPSSRVTLNDSLEEFAQRVPSTQATTISADETDISVKHTGSESRNQTTKSGSVSVVQLDMSGSHSEIAFPSVLSKSLPPNPPADQTSDVSSSTRTVTSPSVSIDTLPTPLNSLPSHQPFRRPPSRVLSSGETEPSSRVVPPAENTYLDGDTPTNHVTSSLTNNGPPSVTDVEEHFQRLDNEDKPGVARRWERFHLPQAMMSSVWTFFSKSDVTN